MIEARKQMCSTCPFRKDGERLPLPDKNMAEIQANLINGLAHMCHHEQLSGKEPTLACRGGRNYQTEMYFRMGHLAAPTDEALEAKVQWAKDTLERIKETENA